MLYVSKVKSGKEIYVTDTDDGVTEIVSYSQLQNITSKGITVRGFNQCMHDDKRFYIEPCATDGNLFLISSRERNKLFITNRTGKNFSTMDFSNVRDNGSVVHYCGESQIISFNSKSYSLIKSEVSVKYDIEFTGLVFILFNNHKMRIEDRTNVLFIDDGYSYSEYGCNIPDFINEKDIPLSINKGMFNGIKY